MSYQERLRDRILAALGMAMIGITVHAAAGDDPRLDGVVDPAVAALETHRSCAARATPRRGGVIAGGEVSSVGEAGDVVGFAK
jgi:hypothetical protein